MSGQAISEEVGIGRGAFWGIASEEAGSGGGGGSEGTHLRGGGLRERRSLEEQPQRRQAQGEAGSEGGASEEAGPGRGGAWENGLRGGGLRERRGLGEPPQKRWAQREVGFGGEQPQRGRDWGEAGPEGAASEEAGSGRGEVCASHHRGGGSGRGGAGEKVSRRRALGRRAAEEARSE